MQWLYFLLLSLSFIVPFLLSFEKRLQFCRRWKYLLPAILIISVVYIVFDIIFTRKGIWGFNPLYHSGITFSGLPLEEYLFFIIIPYASIFLHEALIFHIPGLKTGRIFSKVSAFLLILTGIIMVIFHPGKAYTVYSFSLLVLSLVAAVLYRMEILSRFFLTFIVILIPFMAVNGILTGSLIEDEAVWYNPEEILGIRILTIPIEDFSYGFSLILSDLLLAEKFKKLPGKVKIQPE